MIDTNKKKAGDHVIKLNMNLALTQIFKQKECSIP